MKTYRVVLSYGTGSGYHEQLTDAIFGEGQTLVYAKESNEEYFRKSLAEAITFTNEDYTFIMGTAFDQKISLDFQYYDERTRTWETLILCCFYRTDCEIDTDRKIISVKPTTDDAYVSLLKGIDNEFDLIKLAPKITPVMLDKRPCLQIYPLGMEKVSCFLSNMYWEQDCEKETDGAVLVNDYHFSYWGNVVTAEVSGTFSPSIPSLFQTKQQGDIDDIDITNGDYQLLSHFHPGNPSGWQVQIIKVSTGDVLWEYSILVGWGALTFPRTITLNPVGGEAIGKVTLSFSNQMFFARLLCDVENIGEHETFPIQPQADLVEYNRNYTRAYPIGNSQDTDISISNLFSTDPTEWGVYQPGQYYLPPYGIGLGHPMPIVPACWGVCSYWIRYSQEMAGIDQMARKSITLRDAYLLTDAIDALLAANGVNLTVESTFLSQLDVFDGSTIGLKYITPKSNVLNINYTEPAQKATITLRTILDMLKAVYRCYWQIDGDKLRIEHIEWFRKGGRYTGATPVGADITELKVVRNNKHWSYLSNKYKFDKMEMPCRYEFAWGDDSTMPFNGLPINILSNYVDQERVDKISASPFSADLDFLMLNPSNANKDGFVLLNARLLNVIGNPMLITLQHAIVLEYESVAGEIVSVQYTDQGRGEVHAFDANNNDLGTIDEWDDATEATYNTTWYLPVGTAKIGIIQEVEAGSKFVLTEFNPSDRKVTYWEWTDDDGYSYMLQNGHVSFAFTQRYYAYDMPCRDYQIGDTPYQAHGTSKKKTQEVTFPTRGYYDIEKVVRTGIGDGKVRKLSLNLSSKMAKATLEYDTQ